MEPYVGQVILFAGNFAPYNWALCNGQLMAIQQNTALFSLLGTAYGGNGTSTFGLPDLRGRAPIAFGQGLGLSNYVIGESTGSETITLIDSENPTHTHLPNAAQGGDADTPVGNIWAGDSGGSLSIYSSAGVQNTTMRVPLLGTQGGSQPHENRPPYLVLNYIIALYGIFPSRQ